MNDGQMTGGKPAPYEMQFGQGCDPLKFKVNYRDGDVPGILAQGIDDYLVTSPGRGNYDPILAAAVVKWFAGHMMTPEDMGNTPVTIDVKVHCDGRVEVKADNPGFMSYETRFGAPVVNEDALPREWESVIKSVTCAKPTEQKRYWHNLAVMIQTQKSEEERVA